MKIYKLLIILFLSICLFTGCHEELYNCKVVDKTYQASYTTLIPVYNGKFFYYIYQYHPEQFYLVIEGQNDKDETKRYYETVPKSTWDEIEIGQQWPIEKEGDDGI